jgi:hypothetical protein
MSRLKTRSVFLRTKINTPSETKNGAKMVTLSTGLPFELKNRALGSESLFTASSKQSFRCASRIRARNALNCMAQQIRDVVLVYLSPSYLCCKGAPKVAPDQTTFDVLAKWNPC